MALDKANLAVPFSTGIDTFTDTIQVLPTNLLDLQNAVYTKDKQINKRNGFRLLTSLPAGTEATTLTTFKGNLTAIGGSLQAFNASTATWLNHGRFQPVALDTIQLVSNSTNQSSLDASVSGRLVCSTWADSDTHQKYQINDSVTSQLLVGPIDLPTGARVSRVVSLGNYFVVTFLITIMGAVHLQYIAIPKANLENPSAATDIATTVGLITSGYDVIVKNNYLYVAWDASDGGGAIRATFLDVNLNPQVVAVIPGYTAQLVSLAADETTVWISFNDSAGPTLTTASFTILLAPVLPPTTVETGTPLQHLSSIAADGDLTLYLDVINTYSWTAAPSNYIDKYTVSASGTVVHVGIIVRSVGLASKPFKLNDVDYMLASYSGQYQSSYFLIDGVGNVIAKLSYSNAGGYPSTQVLASMNVDGNAASVAYQFADLMTPVNKTQGIANAAGIHSQFGIKLASFDLTFTNLSTAEIANNLHIAGGFVWMYDGAATCEHNFHLFPEQLNNTVTAAGNIADGTYFTQVTYEWTDSQGNIHRSSPSIPLETTVSGGGGTASITFEIPTLRLTYKENVRIVLYRWSTAQQAYYQVTSITSPLLNDPTVDSVTYIDTLADSSILGNQLIYTSGGVVENIAMPSTKVLTLFKSRLVIINAENPDQIWYSKQVIQGVPVEPSDLFTLFVAPTISAQGSTGSTSAMAAMDDKLILFKPNAMYYITGNGPDNLGQNNDFGDPTFIASTVGTENQDSIVFTPNGLMFQSDKGIWLLNRSLGTQYQSAVAGFNNALVTSSVNIPGTNQIRFTLDTDRTALMYDYYFDRWGTFRNLPAVSSTLYEGMHTYLNSYGQVLQEEVGFYQDINSPVNMAWETAWIHLAGVQGFERAYMCYIIGQYISPHKLYVEISYEYENGVTQSFLLTPSNYAGTFAVTIPFYAQGVFGGAGTLEQWRIFLQRQKVQAFKMRVTEQFDASYGTAPGAGLTFSGLNFVVGLKKGYVPLKAGQSAG